MPGGEEEEDEFFHHWIEEENLREQRFEFTELRASFIQPPPKLETPRGSIRLKFADQSYSLSQLVETLEGLEYLTLLESLREQYDREALTAEERLDPDWLDELRNEHSGQVEIQRLSLNSPLEVFLQMGYMSGALVPILGSWIVLRNRFTDSQLKKARADDEIDALAFRRVARTHLMERYGELASTTSYEDLPKGDILKKLIDKSAESLMNLESVSPDDKSEGER
ncbi:hypothetical protein J7I84_01935 [Arthrobacter sp. ISL-85]|uniref:hypothetical protein n=1 Tax=Arthrobacter sp. ISL-85 TaxID=2819115 RepID=UPI001BEB7147|nr:hypothetical protein [Arthrobacter sp. ISL-85]MBT2565267.1 hypothetical protein [Arthrobacter sp. ISL-85]